MFSHMKFVFKGYRLSIKNISPKPWL